MRSDGEAGKVLIVDDNKDLRMGLEIRLQASGYATVWAESGAAAIRLAFAEDLLAVILDLGLPGEDGLEVLHTFRRAPELAHIPFLVVTGDSSPETKQRVLEAGAIALLEKPVHHEVMLHMLRGLSLPERKEKRSEAAERPSLLWD